MHIHSSNIANIIDKLTITYSETNGTRKFTFKFSNQNTMIQTLGHCGSLLITSDGFTSPEMILLVFYVTGPASPTSYTFSVVCQLHNQASGDILSCSSDSPGFYFTYNGQSRITINKVLNIK